MKDYKSMILPVLSVLALAYGAITGHQIPKAVIDQVATYGGILVGAGVALWGVWKSHQKKGE